MIELLDEWVRWVEEAGWRLSGTAIGTGVSLADLLMTLLLAFVCGQLVAWTYSWSHRGLSYSREFVQSLILVSMIVAMVMLVVGDSLARAFGLVGALAIIRFRTAVRDTRDIAFVFLALAAGIAAGSRHYLTGLVATPLVCLVAGWLTATGFGGRYGADAFLRLHLPEGESPGAALRRVLRRYCRGYSVLSVTTADGAPGREHTYQLQLLHPDLFERLLGELERVEGAAVRDLVLQETEGRS